MSLTSFIKKEKVKKLIDDTFKKPKITKKDIKIKAPPPSSYRSYDYMLIGMAFDYLLRFYLENKYKSKVNKRRWIVYEYFKNCYKYIMFNLPNISYIMFPKNAKSLKDLKIIIENDDSYNPITLQYNTEDKMSNNKKDDSFEDIVDYILNNENFASRSKKEKQFKMIFRSILNTEKNYQEYINNGKLTEELIKSIIDLSKIEGYIRGGRFDNRLGEYKDEYFKDLKRLYQIIPDENFSYNNIYLNPSFGKGSKLVSGADCDIIFDNKLIDIKTTKSIRFTRNHWRQLIGYLTLIDFQNKYNIKSAGIYFSRYGYYFTFNTNKIYKADNYNDYYNEFLDIARS